MARCSDERRRLQRIADVAYMGREVAAEVAAAASATNTTAITTAIAISR